MLPLVYSWLRIVYDSMQGKKKKWQPHSDNKANLNVSKAVPLHIGVKGRDIVLTELMCKTFFKFPILFEVVHIQRFLIKPNTFSSAIKN